MHTYIPPHKSQRVQIQSDSTPARNASPQLIIYAYEFCTYSHLVNVTERDDSDIKPLPPTGRGGRDPPPSPLSPPRRRVWMALTWRKCQWKSHMGGVGEPSILERTPLK